jgi:hypothetical protein
MGKRVVRGPWRLGIRFFAVVWASGGHKAFVRLVKFTTVHNCQGLVPEMGNKRRTRSCLSLDGTLHQKQHDY